LLEEASECGAWIEGASCHGRIVRVVSAFPDADAGTLDLRAPLTDIEGVGPNLARQLARLGLRTVADALKHVPIRYEAEAGEQSLDVAERELASETDAERTVRSLRGEIRAIRHIPGARRPRSEATLECGDRTVRLVWFNATWLARKIHPGMRGVAHGRVKSRGPYLEMTNPRWEPERDDRPAPGAAARLRPIYRASEEVPSWRIERIVGQCLPRACASIQDPVRTSITQPLGLPGLADAYRMVHMPADIAAAALGRRRLAFDELLHLQLAAMMRRWQVRHTMRATALEVTAEIDKAIRARLPFTLTGDQSRVCAEIAADLGTTMPMNRLLQGDVGSGKTAVAAYAMLVAVAHGHQAALVAPTEILAEQHYRVLSAMLEGSRVRIAFLSGSLGAADRAVVRTGLAEGAFDVAVGTHALLMQDVAFRSLAVAVVDEQHRFGVEQRAALREKADGRGGPAARALPHTLVMTATPIPRTLALTLFGDLEVSQIRGRLPGRSAIATEVIAPADAPDAYRRLRARIEAGEQAYVVVPAVEDGDHGLKDVASHAAALRAGPFAGLRIGEVHGRLKAEERDAVMRAFSAHELDVIVATVVIEVGVDVPAATIMVIEHAERFGLAQLHQLRGRVGRGTVQSTCTLVGEPLTEDAVRRLQAIASTTDGFAIAELDLTLRGPGEFFGARQSGLPPLRVADFERDMDLLMHARGIASDIVERDPRMSDPEDALLRRKTLGLYGAALGLGDVA
jgi:ATP-dependent DNA helicase RecG